MPVELFINGFLHIRLLDVVDILLVALLLYELYNLLKGTGAINIFISIVVIILLWKLVSALDMMLLSEILGAFISVGVIALLVVFQPEIRQFLLILGTPRSINRYGKGFHLFRFNVANDNELPIDILVKACQKLASRRTGALIVLEGANGLKQYIVTGTSIRGNVSEMLLENIFFKNSPLHDGAVIISQNKIEAAGCILPVSGSPKIDADLGLRHRAAVGITEKSDAISIVVSEESGLISYSKKGALVHDINPTQLKKFLEKEFIQE